MNGFIIDQTPRKVYRPGTTAQVAVQCRCANTRKLGSFLFVGESHRNYDSRVSPVFDNVGELFAWCHRENWIGVNGSACNFSFGGAR
jgi:hypothetical protein